MPEELKHLLEAIQKDGVEKGETQAREIVSAARQKAQEIVEEARQQAEQIRKQAEQDAASHEERGRKALRQAARDMLIALGRNMEGLMERIVRRGVDQALDAEALKGILARLVEQYAEGERAGGRISLSLSEPDAKALEGFFSNSLRGALRDGLDVRVDKSVSRGFRISFRDEQLYHDFTGEALAEELAGFLRPELREIVKQAVEKQESEQ